MISKQVLTFQGHTSVLLQFGPLKIQIDPVFVPEIDAVRRLSPAIFCPEDAQETDVIFISHLGRFRFDHQSFSYYSQKTPVYGPKNLQKHLRDYTRFEVRPFGGAGETTLENVKVLAIPSLTKGWRYPSFISHQPFHYLFQTKDLNLLYLTDTTYQGEWFHKIGEDHKIDVVVMPIDHVGWDQFVAKHRLNVEKALQAFQDLKATHLVPYGHTSFHRSHRVAGKIMEHLFAKSADLGLKNKIHFLEPGDTLNLENLDFKDDLHNPPLKIVQN